jgi:hypothetical protein
MKFLFAFGFLFFIISIESFATRARLQSLMGSRHLIDEQHLFYNPLLLNHMGSQLSLESGRSNADATTSELTNAETFLSYRSHEQQIYALSLGHQDQAVVETRNLINDLGLFSFNMSQNPIAGFWARQHEDTYFAFSISYSQFEDKLSQDEESYLNLSFGVEAGAWQYFLKYAPVNDVVSGISRFDGAGFIEGNVHFISDGVQGYLTYAASNLRGFNGLIEREAHVLQKLRMGIVDSHELDGDNTFWSADLISVTLECQKKGGVACRKTSNAVMVPVVLGFESVANSWLTLRASIKQSFLFDQLKDEVGYPVGSGGFATGSPAEFVSGPNSTEAAFGAGFNFNRARIDAVILAGGSQIVSLNNILSQVGFVYRF